MMNLGIKKWFKQKSNNTSYKNLICKNCETKFDGKFCPNCGQSVTDYDKPFSFIIYNFTGDFFAFDTRFFHTFVALLFKPGFLTKEYFDGKRVKYAPPFRIFIFASFILFLLLQIYTNKGLTIVLDSTWADENGLAIDSANWAEIDLILNEDIAISVSDSLLNEVDTVDKNEMEIDLSLDTFRDTRDLRHGLIKLAGVLEETLKIEADPKKRAKLNESIRLCRAPEQALVKILKYMSWAFFLLLPIFALILKLMYIRRKQNYMRHLIFSIHIQSFVFVNLTFIIGLYLIFKENLGIITALIFLSTPIYFIIALKKFYEQSVIKVIFKSIAISFLYNIVFWVVVIFVSLNALSII